MLQSAKGEILSFGMEGRWKKVNGMGIYFLCTACSVESKRFTLVFLEGMGFPGGLGYFR